MIKIAILFTALAAASVTTQAQSDPFIDYGEKAKVSVMRCRTVVSEIQLAMALEEATGKPHDMPSLSECIGKERTNLKVQYDALSKQLKKEKARDAFGEHYVATITALDGVRPEAGGEPKFAYDARTRRQYARISEAWLRFEVSR